MKIGVLVGVFILLLIGVNCAYGFEDTVQRYPTGNISDIWTTTGNLIVNNINYPVDYSTSHSLSVSAHTTKTGGGEYVSDMSTNDNVNIDYFAFTSRYGLIYQGNGILVHSNVLLEYVDASDDSIIMTMEIGELIESNQNSNRFEFIRSGGDIELYIDGIFETQSTISSAPPTTYINIHSHLVDADGGFEGDLYWTLDDFSTSSIIGMNEEWTQASTYIDTSYGIQSYVSFPSSAFTMTSSRVGSGTTTNTTTLTSQADFVRWNRTEIYGSDWGLYHVQLFRDSTKLAETTFTYFDSTISGSVAYDQDSYTQGQTANIDYTITSADFATYTYYLKTMDVYANVQDTYTLTAASGTESPTLTDYDSGIYYAILSRTSKSTGVNEEFAYDYASVTETVYINGNVTEAVNGTIMQNVSIQYLQGSTYYNTTSAADGSYNVSDLSVSVSTTVTANATYVNDTNFGNNSYNLSTFSFTPLAAEIYNVDLILFDVNHTYDNVSAYGLVYDNIYHQPIESATVNIYNSTWSNPTTSTTTGYYVFHDLIANGTYSINATASGYIDTIDYEINTTTSNATRQDVPMSTLYTVTVKARDATTLAYLSDFTATLDGTEGTAVNGTVTFNNIEYGLHAISAIADDFYPSATTPLIDEDAEVTLDLTRLASAYYAPHRVKFTVKSLWGTLYSGVTTSVYTGATASGDALYTGTTGTDGAVVFELTEEVQYTLTFIDVSQNIEESRTLYPIHNQYSIIVFGANLIPDDRPSDDILFGCYGKSIDLEQGYINVSFNDTSATTTLAELWINDTNMTNLYYFNTTDSEKAWSQVVDGGNSSYVVVFKLDNTVLDEPLVITRTIKFDDTVNVNLGLDEGWKYQLIAVIIISVIALLGSALNAEKMAVITVLVGWLMVFFGWLQAGATIPEQITLGLMMLFATLIAFGSVIRKGDER